MGQHSPCWVIDRLRDISRDRSRGSADIHHLSRLCHTGAEHRNLMIAVAHDDLRMNTESKLFRTHWTYGACNIISTLNLKHLVHIQFCGLENGIRPFHGTDVEQLGIGCAAIAVDRRSSKISNEERSCFAEVPRFLIDFRLVLLNPHNLCDILEGRDGGTRDQQRILFRDLLAQPVSLFAGAAVHPDHTVVNWITVFVYRNNGCINACKCNRSDILCCDVCLLLDLCENGLQRIQPKVCIAFRPAWLGINREIFAACICNQHALRVE